MRQPSSNWRRLKSNQRLWTCLFFFVLAFAPIIDLGFYTPDEGRYAEIAREMLISGDYMNPHFHGTPHLTKPPLAYWGAALGMKIFGVNSFGARFLPAFMFLGMILAVFKIGKNLFDVDTGRRAAFYFALSPITFVLGHFLSADVFVAFFQIAALALAVSAAKHRRVSWLWLCWLCIGLAFLSKGPPGLLCLIPLVIVNARTPKEERFLFRTGPVLLFFAVATSWYIAQVIRDPAMLRYFLVDEFLERIATSKHRRENTRWLYLLCFTLGTFPWCLGYWRLGKSLRSWFKSPQRYLDTRWLLLASWIIVPLIIFMVSKSRMILYVAPLMAPLMIILAKVNSRQQIRHSALFLVLLGITISGAHNYIRNLGSGYDFRDLAIRAMKIEDRNPAIVNGTGSKRGILGVAFNPKDPVRYVPFQEMTGARSLADLRKYLAHDRPTWIVVKSKHVESFKFLPKTRVQSKKLTAFLIRKAE